MDERRETSDDRLNVVRVREPTTRVECDEEGEIRCVIGDAEVRVVIVYAAVQL